MNLALLQTLLQSPYRRESWATLLPQLLPGLELFAQAVDSPLTNEREREIATARRQFGRATLADGKIVALYEIDVAPDGVDLLRNRVALRQLIARCIDQVSAHAVLAFFIQPGNAAYRLTYAASESTFNLETLALETRETATRRFTYVLGPGETRRTAALRLAGLAEKRAVATLTHVTDAFSVELLNKEFFDIYRTHYRRFCDHLLMGDAPALVFGLTLAGLEGKARDRALKPVRDFVKKLLGRLVFLHFLQKKGWLGCPALPSAQASLPQTSVPWTGGQRDFLRELFNSAPPAEQGRFHSARLVPLFFDTLNDSRRPSHRYAVTGTRVPYLNGGLFERDFDGVERLDFPAALFGDLLDFFGQYHFTIDENDPEDHEIGIDPEMLGHIFENLLEDNKDKGAYYTPKAVVQYMAQQSLIHALAGRFPDDPVARGEIEALIRRKEPIDTRQADAWLTRHATRLAEILDGLKICDPAIGSGAFPIGLLQEIYWTRLTLNPALDRAAAKRAIIQRSIHGVDLDAGAVEIARLRFWLALVVDEPAPVPLPNLDYQIMQGNSLLESFEGERLDTLAEPVRYGRTRFGSGEVELDLGGAADVTGGELTVTVHTPAQHDLADLQRRYFACHEPEAKARLRAEIDAAVLRAVDARLTLRREELEASLRSQAAFTGRAHVRGEAKKRAAMQAELDALSGKSERLHALLSDPRKERPFFLWHLWFREVFEKNGGFDIVIGNPPYVRADNPDFLLQRAAILSEKRGSGSAFVTLWEKWDLYVPFIEQGHTLLRPGGVETMIVSDAYCHSKYAIKSQNWFLRNAIVQRLDFLGNLQIFDAGVKNVIFFYGRGGGAQNVPERRVHVSRFGNAVALPSEMQENATHRLFSPEAEGSQEQRSDSRPLGEICYISIGMVVNAHEKRAHGAFTMDDLVSDTQDSIHCRRFAEGKHLGRWSPATYKWLEWGTYRAPNLFRRRTFPEFYTVPEKILAQRSPGPDPKCCLDNLELHFTESTVAFVRWIDLRAVRNLSLKKVAKYLNERHSSDLSPPREELERISNGFSVRYLLAIMNSRFATNFLSQRRRSNIHVYPDDWKALPIPIVSDADQATVAALVDRILAAKRTGDTATVASLEAEIDTHAFRLYGLTPEEIQLVRDSQP